MLYFLVILMLWVLQFGCFLTSAMNTRRWLFVDRSCGRTIVSCQSNANLQRSTTICGRAANSTQDGPQLRLMQVGTRQSGTLSFNCLAGRGVGFTRHTTESHSITARKIDPRLQFSHRKQAAAHGIIMAITKSLAIRKPTRNSDLQRRELNRKLSRKRHRQVHEGTAVAANNCNGKG